METAGLAATDWNQASTEALCAPANWYAAYTCSRHEKMVAAWLQEQDIEHFLPLYRGLRHWKDRQVELDLPLFPGYVFVRIPWQERLRVLKAAGVVRFVTFNGVPATVDLHEIETLRSGLLGGVRAEPHPYLTAGGRVRVLRGALAGMEGIVKRKKDRYRIVISIHLIMRSIAAEVDACDLEWIPRKSGGERF